MRRGLIRSSVSDADPRVYSVEDVAEAAVVRALLDRGVRHADVHRLVERLDGYGPWPLSEAALATTTDGAPRIVLREDEGDWVLTARGWQRPALPAREVRLRLRRSVGAALRHSRPGTEGSGSVAGGRSNVGPPP